jgi:hypothetical protein
MSMPVPDMFDRICDPVIRALNVEAMRALVGLRADAEVQARVEYLADRCNEGTLTDDERSEYESMVSLSTLIAMLQARARAALRNLDK